MSILESVSTWSGVWPAVIVPMDSEEEINYEEFRRVVRFTVENGCSGIVVNGTTGESPTVTDEEFVRLLKIAKDEVGGRVPIVAGTGSNNTKATITKTRLATEIGVDGVMIVCPYYNKPTQAGLIQHFTKIAQTFPTTPFMTYNVPGRTIADLKPESLLTIVAQNPNVVAHKEASGVFERYQFLASSLPKGFRLFTGEDGQAVEAIANGCVGVVSVVANAFPYQMSTLVSTIPIDLQAAKDLNNSFFTKIHSAAFCEPSPAPIKYALFKLGVISSEGIRGPLLPLTAEGRGLIDEAERSLTLSGLKAPTSSRSSTSDAIPMKAEAATAAVY